MKKIVMVVMVFVFLISSFLSTKIFAFYNTHSALMVKNLTVHIDNKDKSLSAKDYILDLEKTAKDNHLNLKRVVYAPTDNGRKQKIIYYVYNAGSAENRFFANMPMRWGRHLTDNDRADAFLSNIKTNDANQTGQIKLFDASNEIEIRPMAAMENHLCGASYELSTLSSDDVKKFTAQLSSDYNFECTQNAPMGTYSNSDDMLLTLAFFGLLFCLSVLTAIAFLYFVVFRFKEIVIKKMFGCQNKNIIHSLILRDCLPLIGISIGISAIATVVYLIFLNGLACFWEFSLVWLLCQILLAVIFLLVFWIFAQVARSAKSSSALKNKKPLRLIKVINYSVKVLFSAAAVALFAISSQTLFTLLRQNSDMSKWDMTRNYAVMGFTADDSIEEDFKTGYEFDCKMQNFYRLINDEGAMLFAPSGYYFSSNPSEYNSEPDYSPYKYAVNINNNYLKLNPIMDLNGSKVNVPDENAIGMTLLIPEKYKSSITQINKLYGDNLTYYYYGRRDRYLKATGKDLGYDPTDHQQVLAHHEPLKLNIIYVKNNQSYFSFDPNMCKNLNNRIVDPIAMITNNCNDYVRNYTTYLSKQELRAKISDYSNPLKSVNQAISKAGLTENIILVTSLYDQIGEYMHNTKKQIAIELTAMLIALIIVILIIVFSALNYLEESKSINAVKRLHGFPFFKRHFSYLLYPVIFWAVIYILMLALCHAGVLNILNVATAAILMLVIEEIITLTVLRVKESEKLKDILKGG